MKPAAFEKALKDAASALRDPKEMMTQIGLIAQGGVQRGAPVRTGTYRRSITSRADSHTAFIGSALIYAGPLEFGTQHMAAQHPIQSGIDASIADIERKAQQYGAKVFEKVGRG